MRLLYFILYYTLKYPLRLYFRNVRIINKPKKFGKTIFVSNHSAAFMDPLVIAIFNRAILYFMTRSDVFSSFRKPAFRSIHMIPIYRQLDGVNTKKKNMEVFRMCTETLLKNRNLLIFVEGFTDDVFIRRLKPIKKGAARIGFTTLEACNWEEDIYIAAVGINYTNPSRFGSDVLVKNSESIHLNSYKSQYLENPAKVIAELTQEIDILLKSQITHVEDIDNSLLHESIMMLKRKGMADCFENDSDLQSRWIFSSDLADLINSLSKEETEGIKSEIDSYLKTLNGNKLSDDLLYDTLYNPITWSRYLVQIALLPLVLLGFVHCGLIYMFVKRLVENKFRRAVFWSSTKLVLMVFIAGPINLSIFIFLPSFIGWPLSILYFLLIPFFGFIFYRSITFWDRILKIKGINPQNLKKIEEERTTLKQKIDNFVELH